MVSVIGAASQEGNVFVRGSGSIWDNSNGDIQMANGGDGGLIIEDGGGVRTGKLYAGSNGDVGGSILVTGGGSVLLVERDMNLGDYSGDVTLLVQNGGSVIVGDDTDLGVDASATGRILVNDGTLTSNDLTIGYGGVGEMNVSAGGVVTSPDAFIGYVAGSRGAVTITGNASLWDANDTLQVGGDGAGVLTLSDGGTVRSAFPVFLGTGATGSGTINIGAATGESALAPGNIDAPAIRFGVGGGFLVFNHTSTDFEFIPNFKGAGAILHENGTTKLMADSSIFAGTTTVSGGTLYVDGQLGGTINVTGGTLGGSGTLGAATLNSGGTFAPGNSIGTINVASATFNPGSTLVVELNDGGFVAGTNNDLLNSSGTVTINGGTMHVTPENGTNTGSTYTPGTYTIITAAGGVTGAGFDIVSDDYAFLNFAVFYDPNNMFLRSSLAATSFCLTGMSANQCAAGDGTFSLGSGNAVFDAVLPLSNADAPGALDQLSGEIHASARTALLEDSRFAREAVFARLRGAQGGVVDAIGIAERGSPEGGLWAQGFGSWSRWNSDGNAATLGRNIGGLFVGGDGEVFDNVHLGLMGGYSRSSFSIDDRNSSATADSHTLGAYAGGQWDGFTLRGGLAHSWHSIDASRSVAFTGFSDSLSASYNARTLQAYTEAAYTIENGAARLEPFANLAWVNLNTDGFTETGGAAALTLGSQSTDATFTTIGLLGETQVDLDGMATTLSGGIGWRHAFGGAPTSQMRLASGGDAFTIAGVPLAQDTLVLDAGLQMNLSDNATFGLSYSGQLGSGLSDHGGRAVLNISF